MARTLSPTDAAYIAGFFDGEGSVILFKKRQTIQLVCSVTNTHRGVLEWLAETTGVGGVMVGHAATDKWRATWVWHCYFDAAKSFLEQIRPYLVIKGEQADLAFETHARLTEAATGADHDWQREAVERMQTLNHRKRGEVVAYA